MQLHACTRLRAVPHACLQCAGCEHNAPDSGRQEQQGHHKSEHANTQLAGTSLWRGCRFGGGGPGESTLVRLNVMVARGKQMALRKSLCRCEGALSNSSTLQPQPWKRRQLNSAQRARHCDEQPQAAGGH